MKNSRLESQGTLRRRARKQQSLEEQAKAKEWKREVCRHGCAVCHVDPLVDPKVRAAHFMHLATIQGHHIIGQQHLKRQGLHVFLWDVRNGLGVCAYHHMRHENARQRIPRSVLPPEVYRFAQETGLEWLLDREYPPA